MGLFSRFGSFATRIWESIKTRLRPIEAAVEVAERAGVTVEPYDLVREYRKVIRLEGLESQISNVGLEQTIPHNLYIQAELPWKRRFAYTVTMSGRDLKTGRFTRTDRTLTFSREMEIGEIMDAAENYFSATGEYRQVDVTHMTVTGAETRAGDVPW